jgi:histo-blood group ABO system transferase
MKHILSLIAALLFISAAPISIAKPRYKIGLLVMATGKYTVFLDKLLQSAQTYFLPDHDRTYFVFTDGQVPTSLSNIVRIEQKRLGWPYDTMMRFKVYYEAAANLLAMDYLFACDADMLFVDTFGDEILGDRVATRHPGFCMPHQRHDDYEKNPLSTAYVPNEEGDYYFAGGFYGGTTSEFLTLAWVCTERIMRDLAEGIIATWHDESHLNRYFIDYPPSIILDPSYCFPQYWDLPFTPRLLALHKDHKAFQTAL